MVANGLVAGALDDGIEAGGEESVGIMGQPRHAAVRSRTAYQDGSRLDRPQCAGADPLEQVAADGAQADQADAIGAGHALRFRSLSTITPQMPLGM